MNILFPIVIILFLSGQCAGRRPTRPGVFMRARGPCTQVFPPKRLFMVASQLRKTFTLLPAQHSCEWYNLIVRLTSQEQE